MLFLLCKHSANIQKDKYSLYRSKNHFFKKKFETLFISQTKLIQEREISHSSNKKLTSTFDCNLHDHGVYYQNDGGHKLECNSNTNKQNIPNDSDIHIYSSPSGETSHRILMDLWGSTCVQNLHLDNIQIHREDTIPLTVKGAGVLKVYIKGTNHLKADKTSYPGIGCNSESITIQFYNEPGTSNSIAYITGYENAPGIGPEGDYTCGTLQFIDASLKIYGGSKAAGIGPGTLGKVKKIEIQGGTITSKGDANSKSCVDEIIISGGDIIATSFIFDGHWGGNGAGIGSGAGYGEGSSKVGSIKITGGNITAKSQKYGAGIGSGNGARKGSSRVDKISISNCKITATAAKGAGIGSGYGGVPAEDGDGYSESASYVGEITITNSEITATGSYGAGIGSGYGRAFQGSKVGTITITDSKITATGSYGAGIGGGYGESKDGSQVGTVTITNSEITATGNYGAGIGSGYGHGEYSAIIHDKLEIISGIIYAYSQLGSGIGAGYGEISNGAYVEKIEISGGIIHANGSEASGIGGGKGAVSNSAYVKVITISGGTIYAQGDEGSGIGGGKGAASSSAFVNTISISGETIYAYGGSDSSGIGGGKGQSSSSSYVGTITISGGTIYAYAGDGASGIGGGRGIASKSSFINSITISGGSIYAFGENGASAIGGGASNVVDNPPSGCVQALTISKDITELIAYSETDITLGKGSSASTVPSLLIFDYPDLSDSLTSLDHLYFIEGDNTKRFYCKEGHKGYKNVCSFPNPLEFPTLSFTIMFQKNPFHLVSIFLLENFYLDSKIIFE